MEILPNDNQFPVTERLKNFKELTKLFTETSKVSSTESVSRNRFINTASSNTDTTNAVNTLPGRVVPSSTPLTSAPTVAQSGSLSISTIITSIRQLQDEILAKSLSADTDAAAIDQLQTLQTVLEKLVQNQADSSSSLAEKSIVFESVTPVLIHNKEDLKRQPLESKLSYMISLLHEIDTLQKNKCINIFQKIMSPVSHPKNEDSIERRISLLQKAFHEVSEHVIDIAGAGQGNAEDVSKMYLKLGVDQQSDLWQKLMIEIAKIEADAQPWTISDVINEYGINSTTEMGRQGLIEIATIASRNDGTVPRRFSNYGIDRNTLEGQQTIINIAKTIAQTDGNEISKFIKFYGIDSKSEMGQKALVDIAKMAAATDPSILQNLENYGINSTTQLGQRSLIEIIKIVASTRDSNVLRDFQKFGVDPNTPLGQQGIIEIAKIAIGKDVEEIKYIRNLGIDPNSEEGQQILIDIAKIAAAKHSNLSQHIQRFSIKPETDIGQQALIDIAKIAAIKSSNISQCIRNFGINPDTDIGQQALIDVAKIAAVTDPYISTDIKNYSINPDTDIGQQALIDIAKIAAAAKKSNISKDILNFDIKSDTSMGQQALIDIAKLAAHTDLYIAGNIRNYRINSSTEIGQQALIEIAKITAKKEGSSLSQFIQNFDIDASIPAGQQILIEIAVIAAATKGSSISRFIQNYGINPDTETGQQTLVNIAKLVAQHDSVQILQHFLNFGIKIDGEQERQTFTEILELAVAHIRNQNKEVDSPSIDVKIPKSFVDWFCHGLKRQKAEFRDSFWIWGMSLMKEAAVPKNLDLIANNQFIIEELSQCPPALKIELTKQFFSLSKMPAYNIPISINQRRRTAIPSLVLASYPSEAQVNCQLLLNSISKIKGWDDGQKSKFLFESLIKINASPLTPATKSNLVGFLASLSSYNEQREGLALIKDLINIGGKALLARVPLTIAFLKQKRDAIFKSKFSLNDIERFVEKFDNTIAKWRSPEALISYGANLDNLPEPEKTKIQQHLTSFITHTLEGTFEQNRYKLDNNAHLREIFSKPEMSLDAWKTNMQLTEAEMQQVSSGEQVSKSQQIIRQLVFNLENNHLDTAEGKQAILYPHLTTFLTKTKSAEVVLDEIQHQLQSLESQNNQNKPDIQQQKQLEIERLTIQSCIVNILNDEKHLEEKLNRLNELLSKQPANVFKQDVTTALTELQTKDIRKLSNYQVVTSNHPNDFLLMGTEVLYSCQRIDEDPNLNKCVLNYAEDGKHDLSLVIDKDTKKILARSVLRLLIDAKGQPVLFQEHAYTANEDPKYLGLLRAIATKKAQALGIPLLTSVSEPDAKKYNKYPEVLHSKGSPVPFEYVDALISIQEGPYAIPQSIRIM